MYYVTSHQERNDRLAYQVHVSPIFNEITVTIDLLVQCFCRYGRENEQGKDAESPYLTVN